MKPSLFELGYGRYELYDLLKDLNLMMVLMMLDKGILKKSLYSRKISCRGTFSSISYALSIDKRPHPLTRKGVFEIPWFSMLYAKNVDKGPHELTRKGAYRDLYWKTKYIERFGE